MRHKTHELAQPELSSKASCLSVYNNYILGQISSYNNTIQFCVHLHARYSCLNDTRPSHCIAMEYTSREREEPEICHDANHIFVRWTAQTSAK